MTGLTVVSSGEGRIRTDGALADTLVFKLRNDYLSHSESALVAVAGGLSGWTIAVQLSHNDESGLYSIYRPQGLRESA